MDKSGKIGLTAGAFMACAGAASAGTVTQVKSFSGTPTWSTTWSFLGANTELPTGARLLSVQFQLTETLNGEIFIKNISDVDGVYTASATDIATASLPAPVGDVKAKNVGTTSSTTLAAGDTGILNVLGTKTQSSYLFSANLSAFLTSFEVPVLDEGKLKLEASQLYDLEYESFSGQAEGSLYYNYTTAVPEPTTMSLIGVGLAGLAARRARKRKSKAAD
jgi:hypothetical protein